MNKNSLENYFISTREKVQFIKNFGTMLRGGIVINEALQVLADGAETKAFGKVLHRIEKDVEQGSLLSSAFKKEENVFGPVTVSLLQVGEVSGTLDESLQFLSEYLEHSYDLNQEVKSAMIYPKFIFTATIGITVFLVAVILPKLIPLFTQLRVELPLATRILLGMTEFVHAHLVAILVSTVVLVLTYLFIRKLPRVREFIDKFWLAAPLFGGLIRDFQLALFCQLFLTLFRTGSPVNEALEICAKAATNVVYQKALYEVRTSVEQGVPLAKAFGQSGLFPTNMIIMISAGEKSGSLEKAFAALTESYTKEVNLKTKKLPSLIEPMLLILIAVVVGFVSLSIVMPIYGVTQSFSR